MLTPFLQLVAPDMAFQRPAQSRYYGFSDACVKWTECRHELGGDMPWLLFHGARETSEDWLQSWKPTASVETAELLHLLDFPGFGDSWTCGGRHWTLHEWAILMKAAILKVFNTRPSKGVALVSHELSAIPLGMALVSDPLLEVVVRCAVLIDPHLWNQKPERSQLPRKVFRTLSDSWPGPFETREWTQGLARLQIPVLVILTQPEEAAMRKAEQLSRPFPRAEIWFKEGAGPDEVARKVREFSERLAPARAA